MKKPKSKKPNRNLWAILGVTIVVIGGIWALRRSTSSSSSSIPVSRQVMMIAEDQVKVVKPPPTLSALYYAYIAKAYQDGLAAGGTSAAISASYQISNLVFPTRMAQIKTAYENIKAPKISVVTSIASNQPPADSVVMSLSQRFKSDGHNAEWTGTIPKGPGKWVDVKPTPPLTPLAGQWKRWSVNQAITVPPPPVYGSVQDLKELANTKRVSTTRTGEDVNIINFWGGAPGTVAPSGIWQNQLYKTVSADLPKNTDLADRQYAYLQSTMAQTISDAFMECWKVKYTYWTARPDMRDHSIKTAMDDPNFPSYVSGHSTISKAAADVLSILVPKHADQWESMALEARNSRIKAGIHFEIDNSTGFMLGTEVAKQVIQNQNLQAVL